MTTKRRIDKWMNIFNLIAGRNSSTEKKGRTNEKDWISWDVRRGNGRRAARVQGNVNVPFLQSQTKGRRPDQVLPRVLLGLSANTLRNAPAQVPEVQLCLWCERLSPALFVHLKEAPLGLHTFRSILSCILSFFIVHLLICPLPTSSVTIHLVFFLILFPYIYYQFFWTAFFKLELMSAQMFLQSES